MVSVLMHVVEWLSVEIRTKTSQFNSLLRKGQETTIYTYVCTYRRMTLSKVAHMGFV